MIFEPALTEDEFFRSRIVADLEEFNKISDVIVANRLANEAIDVKNKVVTRDLFGRDS